MCWHFAAWAKPDEPRSHTSAEERHLSDGASRSVLSLRQIPTAPRGPTTSKEEPPVFLLSLHAPSFSRRRDSISWRKNQAGIHIWRRRIHNAYFRVRIHYRAAPLLLPWAQSGYLVADQHIAAFRKTVGEPTIGMISRLGGSRFQRSF